MAEGLLKDVMNNTQQYTINSAGLGALIDHPADPAAQQLMQKRGIDISAHRARQITATMIHHADLILVMETWQQTEIEKHTPSAKGKVFRLGNWGKFDIHDPYQKDFSAFEAAFRLIEKGTIQWAERL